jgi:hypothetical protein
VGVVSVILVVLVCGVHLGRAVANLLGGAGWGLPPLVDLFSSLPAVLRGDAGAGLAGLSGHSPSPVTFWVGVVARELTLIAVCVSCSSWRWWRWGPPRMTGMASSREAGKLLGVTRLRKNGADEVSAAEPL